MWLQNGMHDGIWRSNSGDSKLRRVMLEQVIYISVARRPFSTAELDALLARARGNNDRRGITGTLLHAGGHFMQALEGETRTIDAVLTKIRSDPRHHNFTVLLRREIKMRDFADWSMGFRRIDRDGSLPSGFVPLEALLDATRPAGERGGVVHAVLKTFCRNNP